jgi:hypothetical protein
MRSSARFTPTRVGGRRNPSPSSTKPRLPHFPARSALHRTTGLTGRRGEGCRRGGSRSLAGLRTC